MRVGEVCTRPVVSCEVSTSAVDAAQKMRAAHIGNLVVVEDREGAGAIGVLTDRDIVIQVVAKEVDPKALRVGDIMSRDVYTVEEDEPARETIERMRARGVRRLPVVNKAGTLVGIIALDDLLRTLAEDLAAMSRHRSPGSCRGVASSWPVTALEPGRRDRARVSTRTRSRRHAIAGNHEYPGRGHRSRQRPAQPGGA